jgi:hypothetical protein
MNTFIALNSEPLVDRTPVRNPYLRLLSTAVGREVVKGSSGIAVDKRIATLSSHFSALSVNLFSPAPLELIDTFSAKRIGAPCKSDVA